MEGQNTNPQNEAVDTANAVQNNNSSKKVMWFLVLIGGAIIVILVGLIIYFVIQNNQLKQRLNILEASKVESKVMSPTTTPVVQDTKSSWKTYTNSEFGYRLKYPANLYLKERQEERRIIISDVENMGIQDVLPEEKIHVEVGVKDNTERVSLQSYLEKLMGTLNNVSAYSQNGLSGYKLQMAHQSGITGATVNLYFANGNNIYTIMAINYVSGLNSQDFNQMEQILSTFEIINK